MAMDEAPDLQEVSEARDALSRVVAQPGRLLHCSDDLALLEGADGANRRRRPDQSLWPDPRPPPRHGALPALWTESERWVFVGHQDQRVADYAVRPAEDSEDEVEDAARVAPGEKDHEPGDDHRHQGCDPEEDEHEVVGDCE